MLQHSKTLMELRAGHQVVIGQEESSDSAHVVVNNILYVGEGREGTRETTGDGRINVEEEREEKSEPGVEPGTRTGGDGEVLVLLSLEL